MRNWHQLLMHGRRHYLEALLSEMTPMCACTNRIEAAQRASRAFGLDFADDAILMGALKSGSDEDVMALYVDLAEVLLNWPTARLAEVSPRRLLLGVIRNRLMPDPHLNDAA